MTNDHLKEIEGRAAPSENAILNKRMQDEIEYRHNSIQWFLFWELRNGTGYTRVSNGYIDAWAMHQYPSNEHEKVAYEIKVSRGDFMRELKNKGKRRMALRFSNRFWFITPPGICKPYEIPAECGLIEVPEDRTQAKIVVEAPYRDCCPATWNFVASICRSACKKP